MLRRKHRWCDLSKLVVDPSHLEYKTGTEHMVRSPELIDTMPLVPEMKIKWLVAGPYQSAAPSVKLKGVVG
jgi:hypothetical protein